VEMDLNDARLFVLVAEQGTLSKVAASDGVPVSTVSRRVSRLEEQLGVKLLRRTTRQLKLTEAGHAFYAHAQEALKALRQAEQNARAFADGHSGRIRMTAPVSLARVLWPALSEFLIEHPQLSLEVDAKDETRDLVAGGFDLAVRAGPLADSSLTMRELVHTTLCLYASPKFLTTRPTPQSAAQLADYPCIGWDNAASSSIWRLYEGPSAVRVNIRSRVSASEMGLVLQATIDGLGIGLLPNLMASGAIRQGLLERVLPQVNGGDGTLYLVYPEGRLRLPGVQALAAHLQKRAHSLLENAV
jgi:DNA-binding transcriptional LysR family regulator